MNSKIVAFTQHGDHLWFPATQYARGTVVLMHGLNQNPFSWQDMISQLNALHFHVMCVRLTGHRGRGFDDMVKARASLWLADFQEAYEAAVGYSPGLPLYCVAYSLGGLLAANAQLAAGTPMFEKQIFFAPALTPRMYTRLVLFLVKIFPFLPSRSSRKYIANREGTSAAAYRALFLLERMLKRGKISEILNIPTTVMMRREDELVSYRGIKQFIDNNRLSNWSLKPIPRKEKRLVVDGAFQHLIIDEKSVGSKQWEVVIETIQEFFS